MVPFPLKCSKILYQANCTGFFFLGLTKTKYTYWQLLKREENDLPVTGSAWRCVVCMHIPKLPHTLLLWCPSVEKVDILALRTQGCIAWFSTHSLCWTTEDVHKHIHPYVPYCLCCQTRAHPQYIRNTRTDNIFQGYIYRQHICKTLHNYWEQPIFSVMVKESSWVVMPLSPMVDRKH